MITEPVGTAARAFAEHEHLDLVRGVNRIHDVACEIGRSASPLVSVDVLDVLVWIDRVLEPHVGWEESWLYPEIDARAGTAWATRMARFDHQQIRDMVRHVRADYQALHDGTTRDRQAELRCHLFGLEALIRAHVEREERYLLPVLEMAVQSPVSSTAR